MLVLSLRTNVRQANQVLEELNRGQRERTFPRALERFFRTIEHDARAVGLPRLAAFAADAKDASTRVLDAGPELVELLAEAGAEFLAAADAVEGGRRHRLSATLGKRLAQAAAPARRPTPS
jgi:hypothetical protein